MRRSGKMIDALVAFLSAWKGYGTGMVKIIQFREIFFCRDLFPLAAIRAGWFGIVGWVGRSPCVVASSTSLEIDGPTILHGVQPTIFRANSSLLLTNDIEAAREMVGWASYKFEGRGRKQALNQPRTPRVQPTHPTLPNQAPRQLGRNKTRRNFCGQTGSIFITPVWNCDFGSRTGTSSAIRG